MSGAMTATTDQWMQFYQQPLMDGMAPIMEGFSDATVVTTSPTMSSEGILSPSNGQLTPKGNAFKPIRKRSRASKRTPTTLLNANTTNFRQLVQQFTGCGSTAMSLAIHKGPITLNFQQGSHQQILQHSTSGTISPFGTRTGYNQAHHVAVPLPWQKQSDNQIPKQELLQEQQSGYSLDHVKGSDSLPSYVDLRPSMEVSDGLLMVNDFGLHELTVNAFSNDIKNDGFSM